MATWKERVEGGKEEDEGGKTRKAFAKKGEDSYNPVEFGHAWTHGFLNQKPWHPLSFRNQIRKHEAEQKHINEERKREAAKVPTHNHVQRQFELEQEHYRTVSCLDSKDIKEYKDRQELAFMYMKPPGMDPASWRKRPTPSTELEEQQQDKPKQEEESFTSKGPMQTMLKGQALCMENAGNLHSGMSLPHGGIDPSAENQQLIFSESDESVVSEKEKEKRKMKKKRLKDEVKQAEETLAAAGYDVKRINKQLRKSVIKKKRKHHHHD